MSSIDGGTLGDLIQERPVSTEQAIAHVRSIAEMAPEQVHSCSTLVSAAADVYGIGVIFYELPAVDPLSPRMIDSSVRRALETIALKYLFEKDPADRYRLAQEIVDELERVRRHQPTLARPIGIGGRLQRWSKRNPLPATLCSSHPRVTLANPCPVSPTLS